MSEPKISDPLAGISEREREILLRLLRTPRQQQKDAPKPMSVQGIAQRRRREKERATEGQQASRR